MTSILYTIGFTEKSAESFFSLLKKSKTRKLLDVRLNNTSQLAGFAKKNDLAFFLKELCEIEYVEAPELAPEKKMLKDYQEKNITWIQYEEKYLNLISKRNVERAFDSNDLDENCFLCSEHLPHQCHRRLASEYLKSALRIDIKIEHLIETK